MVTCQLRAVLLAQLVALRRQLTQPRGRCVAPHAARATRQALNVCRRRCAVPAEPRGPLQALNVIIQRVAAVTQRSELAAHGLARLAHLRRVGRRRAAALRRGADASQIFALAVPRARERAHVQLRR